MLRKGTNKWQKLKCGAKSAVGVMKAALAVARAGSGLKRSKSIEMVTG